MIVLIYMYLSVRLLNALNNGSVYIEMASTWFLYLINWQHHAIAWSSWHRSDYWGLSAMEWMNSRNGGGDDVRMLCFYRQPLIHLIAFYAKSYTQVRINIRNGQHVIPIWPTSTANQITGDHPIGANGKSSIARNGERKIPPVHWLLNLYCDV